MSTCAEMQEEPAEPEAWNLSDKREDEESSWLETFPAPWFLDGEAHMLPFWTNHDEKPEHVETILEFHTQPCADFQRGFCAKHGVRGKAHQCHGFHFDSQRRRKPVDPTTGQLAYWETPCPSWTIEMGFCCMAGDACPWAHGREEVSYHPAKYKTRACNGTDCRGEGACCFAHDDREMRQTAQQRYSYYVIAASKARAGQRPAAPVETPGRRSADLGRGGGMSNPKIRFCAYYPHVGQCRRGSACSFAHSRDEVQTPLLSIAEEEHEENVLTPDFFTRKFKTMWCPIGAQHDWQTCVYAHTYQDARREPSIGYGPQPCPFWGKKDTRVAYSQRCPLGLRCPYAHGAKEQLYHPRYFRTVTCRDMQMKGCPRQRLCAFYHRRSEHRKQVADTHDYEKPLPEEAIDAEWAQKFLNPPIFQDGDEQVSATGAKVVQMPQAQHISDAGGQAETQAYFVPFAPKKVELQRASVEDRAWYCDSATDAEEGDSLASLGFYQAQIASQRQRHILRSGEFDNSQQWWHVVNGAVADML
mmetsp:Transcript_43289/g.101047  ORF Transcript_43289/g.101047 Transcript_43289/m.101047 type:complete len:529 (+) Transcript_43289:91-1677(+)